LYPLRTDGLTDNTACNYGPGEDYRTANGGCMAIKPYKAGWGAVLMKEPVR
jgi:hypothetical protein